MKAKNIKWDTDGDQEVFDSLPKEVKVPSRFSESDWLSDTYGFCHGGFEVED